MVDHVPEQARKKDQEIRKKTQEFKNSVDEYVLELKGRLDKLSAENDTIDSTTYNEINYQISRHKLIAACFSVHIEHIDACQDIVSLVFKDLHLLKRAVEDINSRSTGKYWWNKFKWFGESARTIATTIAATGIIYASIASGFIKLGGG